MDWSLGSIHRKLLPNPKPKTEQTEQYPVLHLAILEQYITYLKTMSEQKLPKFITGRLEDLTKIVEPYEQEIKKYVFTVPRLKELRPEGQHGIDKYIALRMFIIFLVQLLHHKPRSMVDSCGNDDEIKNLEKELRFLLSVLGDTSLLDECDELKILLAEFEDVANEAGSLVHSLLFCSHDPALGEMNERICVVLNHISLLKDGIMELLDNAVPCVSRTSDKTSVLDALLVLNSLVRDLGDLMNHNDDRIADVKDEIQTRLLGLFRLQPFVKDTGGPQQDQLEECCTRIGDLVHQAQYLVHSILAGDAPRLEDLTKIVEPYAQRIKKYVFTVPRLKELRPEGQHGIDKYRAVRVFIIFLVQLLHHKPRSMVDSCGDDDEIKNLEKELRFLLAVLGDTSLLDECDEFKNLLAEFEDVANEAGSLVHSLLFYSHDPALGEMNERICVALNHISLLKVGIKKLFDNVVPCVSRTSDKISVLDTLLVLDSLVRYLGDLMNHNDDRIADVKDEIQTLLLGLFRLQPFVKDTGGPQQDQLEECCTRIGDLVHQAQYLVHSFLAGDAPRWYLVIRLIHVDDKIENCRIDLQDITMKYKPGGSKVERCFNKQLSSSFSKRNAEVDDDVVGYEGKMTYMLDHLVGGGAELRVISIFGMPGLGKTTLAKKLYNHPLVSDRFDKISWCVVSQTYLKRDVLANILIDIASDEFGKDRILEMEEVSLVEHIHKTLKGRRYLIVMDDIWDSNVCDELLRCFPDDENESRILFTTRNKDVAPHNCIMYELPSLSDDECWELIQKKVFGNQACPLKLEESGRKVASSCRGMPLAAVVIAGILLNKGKEERVWEEVRRNLSSYILDDGENSAMQILKLSYYHLPIYLKLCFLYLGVFFKSREIPARDMMNLWIAEGFIYNENENNAAEEYLKELVDRSLVMVLRRGSDGGPLDLLVHDLLRELCLKICEEEKLMRFVNNKYFGRRRTCSYQIEVPDMRLLRVLYLNSSFIYLIGIEYLVCLKYLVVPDLPPSISNLVNLEYLRVTSNDIVLSSSIMEMKKLKYVDAVYGARYGEDCSTSQTNKLEFLSHVLIRNVKDKKMLKCSPHLRRLSCSYTERVHCPINLSFLTRLESLTLNVNKTLFGVEITSLPSSIKTLTLIGDDSKLCSKTMSTIGRLVNLEVLKLRYIEFEGNEWDTRDGEFEKLRYLGLYRTSLTRWNVESSEHFPKLQQLVLRFCSELGEIPEEIGEIPTMQTIEVDGLLEVSARRIGEEQRDMGNEDLRVVIRTAHG